ncbi:unnamed protein product, partial [Ectocarpus sp. 4 AP-2014]
QKWPKKLERGQPSGPREVHGRRREALKDGRSEVEARWSGDGERPPCQGCLAKEAELTEAIESLELVQLRSRAAVDRCNEQQAELERREEHVLELQRALEEKNSEVLRIELQVSPEETKFEALRLQVCLQQLERENAALRAQAAGRESSSAAAAIQQSLAAVAATASATATATGGGMGVEQGVVAAPPVGDDLGTAFVRRQLEDACAKAVFAQHALDPERGLLQMGDELGAGGHGTVRKAVDPTTGKTYAVKTANDEEGKTCLKHEAKNLIRLGTHEGVVEIMAILDKDNSMAIVMELGQTDLQHAMFDQKRTVVELLTYAAQVADGVNFMHGKGLVHGDVKPDLVKKSKTLTVAKLADLGLSRAVGERKYRGCGTLGNSITPNNFFRAVPANKADDVWALGVLLLSLLLPRGLFSSNYLTSRVLHTAAEREALARSATSRERLQVKYGMSFRTANDRSENGFQKRVIRSMLFVTLEQDMRDIACSFLRRMVDPDASERPDIGEVRAWLPSIIQSAERQTRAIATATALATMTTPSPPPLLALSRGGSVSTISFLSSSGSSGASSATTSSSSSSPPAGSAPSTGSSVESFSSSRSGGLAALLEDEDGMAVSGNQEDAIPDPCAAATTATVAGSTTTSSIAPGENTLPEGDDISVPDSWMPSDDGCSLALAVGAATSGQDDEAHNSDQEDASLTISGVSTLDVIGINSSVETFQQQGALSSKAGSVRLFSGVEAAGASDGLLPQLSGGECSTSGSGQSRGGEGEETVDAEGWSEPVVTGGESVEGVNGNGNEDAGTLSAVDVTLALTPAVPAMVMGEGPTGDGTFSEDWGVGGECEYLGSGERGAEAEAVATTAAAGRWPRQQRRLGIFMRMISEGPAAATATATAGAAGASPTMTPPPPIMPESFVFEGVSTAVGQERWVLDREMTVAGGGIDLPVTTPVPLPQEMIAPEVNMGVQCDRYGCRRRLPCFASFH